jgi:5-bromo-4-chloroindolyl phosphate hydrolysis protein
LLHAGSLVDKLITITKESKDREIQQKMEDDRLWLRNEIDSIIEKRLGAVSLSNRWL